MDDNHFEYCWDYWHCSQETKEKCAVHATNAGRWCWQVESFMHPRVDRNFKNCWECPWFARNNPDI